MEPPIFLTALLLLAKGCEVLAQQFECFSQSSPGLYATSYVQPTGQISVPAIIRPIIASNEPTPTAPAVSSCPDYGSYPFMPPPMPPIIINRDDNDDFYHLMYFLIFALSKNRDRGCGYNNGNCGCGGNFGCSCCGNGYSGNNLVGNNCGGNNYCGNGCSGNNCGNNGYCENGCGYYGNGNYDYGGVNGYGYSGGPAYDSNVNYGGNNINNCGTEIRYIPFPIAVPLDTQYSLPSFSYPFSYPDNMPSKPDYKPSPGPALPSCNCDCGDPSDIYLTIRTSDCQ